MYSVVLTRKWWLTRTFAATTFDRWKPGPGACNRSCSILCDGLLTAKRFAALSLDYRILPTFIWDLSKFQLYDLEMQFVLSGNSTSLHISCNSNLSAVRSLGGTNSSSHHFRQSLTYQLDNHLSQHSFWISSNRWYLLSFVVFCHLFA